jgi:hypothetical protein
MACPPIGSRVRLGTHSGTVIRMTLGLAPERCGDYVRVQWDLGGQTNQRWRDLGPVHPELDNLRLEIVWETL